MQKSRYRILSCCLYIVAGWEPIETQSASGMLATHIFAGNHHLHALKDNGAVLWLHASKEFYTGQLEDIVPADIRQQGIKSKAPHVMFRRSNQSAVDTFPAPPLVTSYYTRLTR